MKTPWAVVGTILFVVSIFLFQNCSESSIGSAASSVDKNGDACTSCEVGTSTTTTILSVCSNGANNYPACNSSFADIGTCVLKACIREPQPCAIRPKADSFVNSLSNSSAIRISFSSNQPDATAVYQVDYFSGVGVLLSMDQYVGSTGITVMSTVLRDEAAGKHFFYVISNKEGSSFVRYKINIEACDSSPAPSPTPGESIPSFTDPEDSEERVYF